LDLSLFRITSDFCYALFSHDSTAVKKTFISVSVPTLTRMKEQVKGWEENSARGRAAI
jgi:hypothetical protein